MDASLKQRLVGAAVLVALAVIFLPMLIKQPAPDSGVSSVSLGLPPEPKTPDAAPVQDLPLVAPAAVPAGGASGMPGALAGQAVPDAPDGAMAPMAAVAAGGFAVSFGSYASAADADKVIAALAASGLPGYREAVSVGGKPAQRVRIGPFADQASAESARLRAGQVRNDVETRVVVLDGDNPPAPAVAAAAPAAAAPKPAAKPAVKPEQTPEQKPVVAAITKLLPKLPDAAPAAQPAAAKPEPSVKPAPPANTGFVVQIGAFSSAADATGLRDALRRAGFNTFTDTVPGANGSLTRVRVGPVPSRAEADALKAQVKAKTGRDGMVRAHP